MSLDTSNKVIRKRCLDCHYALDYLTTDRCPECGRQFDHLNPATWWDIGIDPPLEKARRRLIVGIIIVALLDASIIIAKNHMPQLAALLFFVALIAHFSLMLLGMAEMAARPWRIRIWALIALAIGLWPIICILIALFFLSSGYRL